jgi:small-conductance mechanosensitive channel
MQVWQGILAEAQDDYTALLIAAFLLTAVLYRRGSRADRRRVFGIGALVVLHLVLLPIVGTLRAAGASQYRDVRLACLAFAGLAAVSICGIVLFSVVLPRLRLTLPKIVQDVTVGVASVFMLLAIAARAGFNLSGLITTSAVLTAVIGLALQDTLGNIASGLALQTDGSIRLGDWIRVGQREGRVTEIRWRYTALETRDWETLIIPNSQLVKEQVVIIGRRAGQPQQWRRWVRFNVDFRHHPTDVVRIVEQALLASPIPLVAATPTPDCVFIEIQDSWARYAVRYWLTDLERDAAGDSRVLTRIYYALTRAHIALSIPAHAVFVTEESEERKLLKGEEEHQRRLAAIGKVEVLTHLSAEEQARLATRLQRTPFSRGEVLAHQGEHGDCMYLVTSGEVSVRVSGGDGLEREVARLGPGNFFGEMSLLTGEHRSASVTSLSDVECYRVGKLAFEEILSRRPEIAESLAQVLAERRVELAAAREDLDADTRKSQVDAARFDLLGKIRGFFGLDGPGSRAAN